MISPGLRCIQASFPHVSQATAPTLRDWECLLLDLVDRFLLLNPFVRVSLALVVPTFLYISIHILAADYLQRTQAFQRQL